MKAIVDTVKTDSFSMEYCKFGTGDRSIAIIPGLSIQSVLGMANAIATAYEVLAKDFTLYVFERRNDLPSSYTVNDTARDTVAAIRALGMDRVSLCGASYGGMVSMTIALEYPELVEKVVVASTDADVSEEDYKVVGGWCSLAKKGDARELYRSFGEALYTREVYEQMKDLLVAMADNVTEEDLRRFIVLGEGMKGFKVIDRLDKIQCPLMVIGDKQDNVLGAAASEDIIRVMKNKPGFDSYMYDGYGHAVFDLAPDFKERILKFLK